MKDSKAKQTGAQSARKASKGGKPEAGKTVTLETPETLQDVAYIKIPVELDERMKILAWATEGKINIREFLLMAADAAAPDMQAITIPGPVLRLLTALSERDDLTLADFLGEQAEAALDGLSEAGDKLERLRAEYLDWHNGQHIRDNGDGTHTLSIPVSAEHFARIQAGADKLTGGDVGALALAAIQEYGGFETVQ